MSGGSVNLSAESCRKTAERGDMLLFELGKNYVINLIHGDDQREEIWNCIVQQFDQQNGLLKVKQGEDVYIFNVKSPGFFYAKLLNY